MGISILPSRYRINGVLSTDATVMQNMETLAGAAQSWFTYDVNAGKWSVNINQAGSAVATFDDSNIIGGINYSGTGLRDLYNRVKVEFPHVDLNDQVDSVEIAILPEDRNANEPDNTLNIKFDVINDPVMAEMLGLIELKQSRVDLVVQFQVDYSYLGLRAGDLIGITNSVMSYTNKMFRIISIAESDSEDGAITLNITALEYDANVYDTSDLFRFERTDVNGIVTIGGFGQLATPTITTRAQNSRPGVVIQATVPSGIVEGMEFWYSTDNVNFELVSTERNLGGGPFAAGSTVSFDYDKVVTGNVHARCRAINSVCSSAYSDTATVLEFAPVQVTNALNNNSEILDDSGNPIVRQLGLSQMLGGLDTFLDGNPDMVSVFESEQNFLGEFAAILFTGSLSDRANSSTGPYNAIVGNGATMFGFNIPDDQTTPAFKDFGPGPTHANFTLEASGITLGARSNPNRLAVYYNWAPWDVDLYNAGGLAGLNWDTHWVWCGNFADGEGDLAGPNKFLSTPGVGEVSPFDSARMNGQPGLVIFGVSTTIVPGFGGESGISFQLDPVSGVTRATFLKSWLTNTVLIDPILQGPTQFPGRTGGSMIGGGRMNLAFRTINSRGPRM